MRLLALLFAALLGPSLLWAQSASEMERCFQNPATCSASAPAAAPAAPAAPGKAASAADYAAVLQSPDADRRKIQESLRTLEKYNGPIDGNLQSEATMKAISEWQKGHGHPPVGKLTPAEWIDPVKVIVGPTVPKRPKLKNGIDHRRGVPPGRRARVACAQTSRSLGSNHVVRIEEHLRIRPRRIFHDMERKIPRLEHIIRSTKAAASRRVQRSRLRAIAAAPVQLSSCAGIGTRVKMATRTGLTVGTQLAIPEEGLAERNRRLSLPGL